MAKHLLLVFILISKLVIGQMDMSLRPDSMTDSDYKRVLNNNPELDPYYKHNKYAAYFKLNASPDTVFKYLYEALQDKPVIECYFFQHGTYPGCQILRKVYDQKKINKVCALCDSIEKNLDSTIIKMMAIIYSNDQKYRALDEGVPLIGNLLRQHNLDSVNQVLIAKMIEQKKKYLGADIVGYELQDVAFFVIQHADLPYQEKYLPMVEQAIADRNLYKSCYPLLVDRINMDKGIPQIFGTQLTWNKKRDGWELYKVQSMYKINELRKKYDLEPLGDYLKDCHAVIPNKTK